MSEETQEVMPEENWEEAEAERLVISVANDPRSREAVRRIRSACALVAFAAAGLAALRSGLPLPVAALRALGAGVVSWLVAWWAAVTACRHLIRARIRAAVARAREAS